MAGTAGTHRNDAASTKAPKTPAQLFAYLAGAVLVVVGLVGFAADSSFVTGSGVDGDKRLGIFESTASTTWFTSLRVWCSWR